MNSPFLAAEGPQRGPRGAPKTGDRVLFLADGEIVDGGH